jgi:Uma2 family endonuclease
MATTVEPRPIVVPIEQRFVLFNIGWEGYEAMLKILGDRPIRTTYDRGNLELMSPSRAHEEAKYLLGCVIDTVTEELHIPRRGAGSTTWRREDLDRGLEPDACFYLANAERVRGKALDLSIDPPPDLAIEVDITRSSLDRMGVYAKLGVPEIWRYDGESLRIYLLQADGNYAESETSRSLPFLLPGEVARFLEQAGPMDHSEWGRQFRQWVRGELTARLRARAEGAEQP